MKRATLGAVHRPIGSCACSKSDRSPISRLAMEATDWETTTSSSSVPTTAGHAGARAKATLGDRLAQCDETWVPDSSTPVLIVVLCEYSDRARIEALFGETPWGSDKPHLQVLDAATWQALEGLAAAGMISMHARATRPLLPDFARDARESHASTEASQLHVA